MSIFESGDQGQVPTAEAAIGKHIVGFIGDPDEVPDVDKWLLHDALAESASLLGEVVGHIWDHVRADADSGSTSLPARGTTGGPASSS